MRGKRYDPEVKERSLAMLAGGSSLTEISNELSIPKSTLCDWQAAAIVQGDETHFAELRKRRKEQFINSAWDCVERTLALANRRILTALEGEEQLGELIADLKKMSVHEIDEVTRWNVINKLGALKIQSIKDLSHLIAICFDKATLASGGETERLGVNISIETLVRELKQLDLGQED